MNIEIEKQIASIIEAAKSAGSDTVDFIKKQSPDYFYQLVKWTIWDGILTVFYSIGWLIVALIGSIYVIPIVYNWWQSASKDGPAIIGFILVIALFAAIGATAIGYLTSGIDQIIKAKIAPKVVIMDAIKDALRGSDEEE